MAFMGIENLFRYTALAVGLKPSAMQGKARLRGLYRIISSKTIPTEPLCDRRNGRGATALRSCFTRKERQ